MLFSREKHKNVLPCEQPVLLRRNIILVETKMNLLGAIIINYSFVNYRSDFILRNQKRPSVKPVYVYFYHHSQCSVVFLSLQVVFRSVSITTPSVPQCFYHYRQCSVVFPSLQVVFRSISVTASSVPQCFYKDMKYMV